MKPLLLIFLTVSISSVSVSQSRLKRKAPVSAPQNVLEVNRAWVEAFAHCDHSTLAQIVADDSILTNEFGFVTSKAEFIALMRDQEPEDCKSDLAITEVRVQSFGANAIVTGLMSEKQGEKRAIMRYTNVFVHRKGRWEMVTSQVTHVVSVTLSVPQVVPPKPL